MRYFLAGFLLLCLIVVSVAGFRGSFTRRSPIELFPDMDRQAKLRPQAEDSFFPDDRASRLHPANTVPRGTPVMVNGQPVYRFEEVPFNTGLIPGTTNFVEINPQPITAELLARGRERYSVTCAPCHGAQGDGKGVTTKYGMAIIADLHDMTTRKVVQMPDGQLFDTITNGKNLMQGYGAQIVPEDRWAIVAYVRALQLSRLATLEEVPAGQRAALKK
jgi:mono/diheme cytochrome c family protein